ncbi:putative MFS family arabinose efflux permease [Enemella evansiae]|nr:putative MFS family arabinose efflux permease [Enemella evansiae]
MVLMYSAFVFVSSELFPLSALATIAADLGVSESRVGLLLSGYAVVVAVTVVPVTRWASLLDRRTALGFTLACLALSGLGSALAPSYAVLIVCRLVMALGHGLFWASVGSVAARLAPAGRQGRATATVFTGNALALILGVPLLNAGATALGWRWAAGLSAVAAGIAAIALWRALPSLPPVRRTDTPNEPTRAGRRQVFALSASTLLVVAAYFATYTFVTPLLDGAGIRGAAQSGVLLGLGALGLAGIRLTAAVADGWPLPTLVIQSLVTTAAFGWALVAAGQASTLAWLGLLALSYSGLAVSWQGIVLKLAPDWPDEASSIYIVAFQIGIATGPAVGGLVRVMGDWVMFAISLALAAGGVLAAALIRHPGLRSVGRRSGDVGCRVR